MSTPPDSFAKYLEQVRRLTWQRQSTRALVTWLGVSLLLIAAFGSYSAWSGRGDLGRVLCLAGIILAAWVCASERWNQFGRKAPSKDSCAQAIAKVQDPVHATLRQDIFAAWRLGSQSNRQGSPALRDLYLQRVEQQLVKLPAEAAIPATSSKKVWATLLCGTFCCLLGVSLWTSAFASLWSGHDARAPLAPQIFWSSVGLHITYPRKAQRPPKYLEPVAGQLSLPVGSRLNIQVRMPAHERFSSLSLKDKGAALALELAPREAKGVAQIFEGELEVTKTLRLELFGVDKDSSTRRPKHGPAFSIAALADKAPQVELAPGKKTQRTDRDGQLAVAIDARDDFGLRSLSLHYQSPGQPADFVPIELEDQPKNHKDTFIWNLASIPVQQRSDLVYWIEARDNDEAINPEDNRPGKVTRTSPRTLIVEDARARHQQNLRQLAALRDEAVDLLARYMSSDSKARLDHARAVQEHSTRFLSNLARLNEALKKDRFAARATRRVLSKVHKASQSRHELAEPILRFIYSNQVKKTRSNPLLGTPWPEDNAPKYPQTVQLNSERIAAALDEWAKLLPGTKAQLEDDILRLDDLVDAELMDQLDALMAGLKKAQKKLVRWLDTLDMSDPKSKARVTQLQARIELDMQRVQELQSLLRDEVDPGFFNQDALAELAERMKHQSLKDKLNNGDLKGAKQAAKDQLSKMESVQEDLQEQSGPPKHLSPKEKAQRFLRRQLAELSDEQADLLERTPRSLQASPHSPTEDLDFARKLKTQLSKIKDTQLNRPGRKALQAAQDALEDLERKDANAADRFLATEELRHQLHQALEGTPKSERAQISKLLKQSQAWADASPGQPGHKDREDQQKQEALAKKLQAVGQAPQGQEAMTPGIKRHLQGAAFGMQESVDALKQGRGLRSSLAQEATKNKIQSALDELQKAPPPPPPSGGEEVSMQAKQDKSLREAVLEVLEKDSKSLSPGARAYYESLLEP